MLFKCITINLEVVTQQTFIFPSNNYINSATLFYTNFPEIKWEYSHYISTFSNFYWF